MVGFAQSMPEAASGLASTALKVGTALVIGTRMLTDQNPIELGTSFALIGGSLLLEQFLQRKR